MDFSEILALSPPAIMFLLVIASIVHALFAARKATPEVFRCLSPRVIIVCLLHLVIASGVYWHLITDGWLTNNYHWDDPNNINLVLVMFEAFCAVVVVLLGVARKRFFYKLLIDLVVIQFILVAGFLILLLIFMLTWHPKMF